MKLDELIKEIQDLKEKERQLEYLKKDKKKMADKLLEKAKENNTTLSLLVRKRIFDYDNWFKGINTIKEIEKLEKGE